MKYHSRKTIVDGIKFDSKREAERYTYLSIMQKAGLICDLKRQVRYELLPAQRINGKVVERGVSYYADYVYVVKETGETVVEDVKGFRDNPVWILKRKLMLYFHGIRVKET